MTGFLFLMALILTAAVCGAPGLLFSRLLRRAGLPAWAALAFGSAIIPATFLAGMSGGSLSGLRNTPWWFCLVIFPSGLMFGCAYFRRYK